MALLDSVVKFAVFGAVNAEFLSGYRRKLVFGDIFDGSYEHDTAKEHHCFNIGPQKLFSRCHNFSSVPKNDPTYPERRRQFLSEHLKRTNVFVVVVDINSKLKEQIEITESFLRLLSRAKKPGPKILAAVSLDGQRNYGVLDEFYKKHGFDELMLITSPKNMRAQLLIAAYRVANRFNNSDNRKSFSGRNSNRRNSMQKQANASRQNRLNVRTVACEAKSRKEKEKKLGKRYPKLKLSIN